MESIILSTNLHDEERKKKDNILKSGGDTDFVNSIASKKPFPLLNKDVIIAMSKRNPPLDSPINNKTTLNWCKNCAIAMLDKEKNEDIIENLSMTLLAYLSIAKEK